MNDYKVFADILEENALVLFSNGHNLIDKPHRSHFTRDFGLEAIGRGSYRWVVTHFEFPGVVFKISRWSKDARWSTGDECGDHNRTEWTFYNGLEPIDRELFAEPYYITENGVVLVMKKISKTAYVGLGQELIDRSVVEEFRKSVRRPFHSKEKSYYLADLHSENIGIVGEPRDGNFVLIDYGFVDEA